MRARLLAGGVLTAALVAAGCSDRTQQEAREAGHEAAQAAQAAGEAVESAAGDAVRGVERANDAAQREASEAAERARTKSDAAAQTAEVKAALIADSRVDAGGIDVDTDDRAKVVTLTGQVPSAAQKLTAGSIAHEKAEGYEIRNELAVRP